jgi:hypothetical protein
MTAFTFSDVAFVRQPSAGSITVTFLGVRDRFGTGDFADFTNPAPATGQRLVFFISGEPYGGGSFFSATVNGGGTISPVKWSTNGWDNSMSAFETAAPGGSTITIASIWAGGAGVNYCACYLVAGGTLRDSAIIRGASPQTAVVDVAEGGAVLGAVSTTWYNGSTLALTAGVTSDGVTGSQGLRAGSAAGLSASAAYGVTGTSTDGNPFVAAISMEPA